MVYLRSLSTIDMNITGLIDVINVAFQKEVPTIVEVYVFILNFKVMIRYTLDNWYTWTESRAIYDASSTIDSHRDTFNFFISFPSYLPIGTKCQFCVRYRDGVDGNEYWDNNEGKNYIIECVIATHGDDEDMTDEHAMIRHNNATEQLEKQFSLCHLNIIDYDDCHFY